MHFAFQHADASETGSEGIGYEVVDDLDDADFAVVDADSKPAVRGIVLAGGFMSHGEPARLLLDARGRAKELQLAGMRYLPEAKVAKELARHDAAATARPS